MTRSTWSSEDEYMRRQGRGRIRSHTLRYVSFGSHENPNVVAYWQEEKPQTVHLANAATWHKLIKKMGSERVAAAHVLTHEQMHAVLHRLGIYDEDIDAPLPGYLIGDFGRSLGDVPPHLIYKAWRMRQ
jgi:hypothetical protein